MVVRSPQIDRELAKAAAQEADAASAVQTTTEESPAPEKSANAGPIDPADVEPKIVEALRQVFDPEIPVNIYELGLIYDIEVGEDGHVEVKMTLTSPACPVAGTLPGEAQMAVEKVDEVASANVEVVWDPAWNPSMMTEAARLELGMM